MKIRSVEYIGTVVDPKAPFPADLPQVAFSGRSNVGKSSLINTLLGRTKSKVARVSATPGKTQALNFYRVNDTFLLVDLPGFGFAKAPAKLRQAWKPLIEGYLARSDGPRAVVHLVDVRRDPTDHDLQMLDYLSGLGIPTLVGITKVDKLTHERRGKVIPALTKALALDPGQVVPVSSKTGEGKDDLLGAIERIVEEAGAREAGERD